MKLFIKLSYVGTRYCGYQVQPGKPTVQKALGDAAHALFGVECDVTGCSRTDSGVHAKMFCATLAEHGKPGLTSSMDASKVPLALSAHLPNDIAVYEAAWVEDTFHARYDVKEKEYLYRILNRPVRDPFEEGFSWHLPTPFSDEDISRMDSAAKVLIGNHDFAAFCAAGTSVSDTRRTITSASVTREGDMIFFRVSADGFLYHMVRILTGTLLEVGEGKRSADDILRLLSDPKSGKPGMTAPAEGLYLLRVTY